MERAAAVSGDRFAMEFAAIAFVFIEMIVGKLGSDIAHSYVSFDFGDDGGSGNECVFLVAFDDGDDREIEHLIESEHVITISNESCKICVGVWNFLSMEYGVFVDRL